MSKKKEAHIAILLDETGSMELNKLETYTGFNGYLEQCAEDKKLTKAKFSFTRFNTLGVKVERKAVNLASMPRLNAENYRPQASTNLYDAIGETIRSLEEIAKHGALMVIITDGQENSSKEFTKESIRKLITEKEAQGWAFVYLGAGFDAFEAGTQFGAVMDNIGKFENTAKGYVAMYRTANEASSRYAGGQRRGLVADIDTD